jgi:hypothetical protein
MQRVLPAALYLELFPPGPFNTNLFSGHCLILSATAYNMFLTSLVKQLLEIEIGGNVAPSQLQHI